MDHRQSIRLSSWHKVYLILFFICVVNSINAVGLAQVRIQDNPLLITPVPAEQPYGKKPDPILLKTTVVYTDEQEEAEGKVIHQIEFEGNETYCSSFVRQKLNHLTEMKGQSLDPITLEQALKEINQKSPFKVLATVDEGEQPNQVNVHLDVYEQQPWQVIVTTDNQGRPHIGTQRYGVTLENSSLLGFGDTLELQNIGASGTQYYYGKYAFPVNRYGGRVSMTMLHNNVDVELGLPGDDFEAEQTSGILAYSHPINSYLTVDGGLVRRRVHANLDHVDPTFGYLGARFKKNDHLGLTDFYVTTFLGEEVFGGDAKFWRMNYALRRTLNLPHHQMLQLRLVAQNSPDLLIPIQMQQLTGAYYLRGTSEGLLYADYGWVANLEYFFPIPFLGRVAPQVADNIWGVAFVDYAQGWINRERGPGNNEVSLFSAGVGLRARLTQYLQGFVDVAWLLNDHTNFLSQPQNYIGEDINQTVRVHFGIRSELLPKAFKKRGTKTTPL